MARVKDWLIDMENYCFEAQEKGIENINEIVKYCRVKMGCPVDERYIREFCENRSFIDDYYEYQ